jgi:NurA-like 5'-3' nuclease
MGDGRYRIVKEAVMDKIKRVMVSGVQEALAKARELFAQGEEFVIAEGKATLGGFGFEQEYGTLLMHCSERAVPVYRGDVEAAKKKLLETEGSE